MINYKSKKNKVTYGGKIGDIVQDIAGLTITIYKGIEQRAGKDHAKEFKDILFSVLEKELNDNAEVQKEQDAGE